MGPQDLPQKFKWILNEPGPKIIFQMLKYYRLMETPGKGSTPLIMQWAKELGVTKDMFPSDATPWCGLGANYNLHAIGYPIPPALKLLAAKAILDVPGYIKVPKGEEMFGDIMVFNRPGGNHEAFNCGENENNFLTIGANTSDRIEFAFIAKNRLTGTRRPKYNKFKPRKKILNFDGTVSTNEA